MADFNYNVDVLPIVYSPAPGPPGDSAYTVAVQNGFVGSEAAWLSSLVGPSGPSAYSIAVAQGFSGDEAAWLISLEGESAYAIALDNGYNGDEVSWLASLIGPPGASAYQTWLQNGNAGTEAEFLNSLIGAKGPSGDSAYSIAVQNGFSGSEAQWLASLVGPSGSTTWSAISGKPATFPPSPHTHAESDVTNLVADLNNRVLTSSVVQGGQSLTGGGALTSTALTLTLVNDSASPGAGRFYATNLSGVRGWIPYGTAAQVNVPGSGNATNAQAVLGNDTRLADTRSPKTHAASHGSGGGDQVTLLRAQISDLPGVVNTASMGFVPQLPTVNPTTVYFRGDGSYAAPTVDTSNLHVPWSAIINPPLSTVGAPGLLRQLNPVTPVPGSGSQVQTWCRGDDTWQPLPVTTYTNAAFNIPVLGASTTVAVNPSPEWPQVTSCIYFSDGTTRGFLECSATGSGPYTSVTLTNQGFFLSAAPGTLVNTGALLSLRGPSVASTVSGGLLPPFPGTTTTFLRGDGLFAAPTLTTLALSGQLSITYAPATPNGSIGTAQLVIDNLANGNNAPSLAFNYRNASTPLLLQFYLNGSGLSAINQARNGGLIVGNTGQLAPATTGQSGAIPLLPSPSGAGSQTKVWLRGDNAWQPLPETDYLSAGFTVPAIGSTVVIQFYTPFPGWPNIGTGTVYFSDGTFRGFLGIVSYNAGAGQLTVLNRGNATAGNTPAADCLVRLIGPGTASATAAGLVPTPPNNTTTYLRGDGTFAAPPGTTGYLTTFVGPMNPPSAGGSILTNVGSSANLLPNMNVLLTDGVGFMNGTITSVVSGSSVVILNVGAGGLVGGSMNSGVVFVGNRTPACDVQVFTSAGLFTWTKPTTGNPTSVEIICIGGGGGGGGGGSYSSIVIPASLLGTTAQGNVGIGGTGGTAVSTSGTAGSGGLTYAAVTHDSWFGSNSPTGANICYADGGRPGTGGAVGGAAGTGGTGGVKGQFAGTAGGAGSASGAAAGAATAPTSVSGAGGGGGGGGFSTGNAEVAGALGATYPTWLGGIGAGAAGLVHANGGAGSMVPLGAYLPGAGGGGGGSSNTAATRGGNGGPPSNYGGGGGGGGAGDANANAVGAGAGGGGAWGCVIVITYF